MTENGGASEEIVISSGSAAQVAALVSCYVGLFSACDFVAASGCYRLPFTWFFGARPITVSTAESLVALLRQSRERLAERGLSESRLVEVNIHMLGHHAALAGTLVARIRADGSEIERIAGTYLVHHDGSDWRLAANVTHPVGDGVAGNTVQL